MLIGHSTKRTRSDFIPNLHIEGRGVPDIMNFISNIKESIVLSDNYRPINGRLGRDPWSCGRNKGIFRNLGLNFSGVSLPFRFDCGSPGLVQLAVEEYVGNEGSHSSENKRTDGDNLAYRATVILAFLLFIAGVKLISHGVYAGRDSVPRGLIGIAVGSTVLGTSFFIFIFSALRLIVALYQ